MAEPETFTIEEWLASDIVAFDATAEYDEHVRPVVDELIRRCERFDLPLILHIAKANSVEGCAKHFVSKLGSNLGRVPPDMIALSLAEEITPVTLHDMGVTMRKWADKMVETYPELYGGFSNED